MEVSKKWQTALIWLIGLVIIVLIVFVGMEDYLERWVIDEEYGSVSSSETTAEEYYNESSTVLNTISVYYSTSLQTEAQAIADFTERGFDQYAITYDYSYDGNYLGDTEASKSGNKHPMYQTYYISSVDEVWVIIISNGSVYANPLSYNLESELDVVTLISESNVITGYDSDENVFYETIPNETEMNVIIVDEINTETLDSLTNEEIDRL